MLQMHVVLGVSNERCIPRASSKGLNLQRHHNAKLSTRLVLKDLEMPDTYNRKPSFNYFSYEDQ
jgi:hypothetical protein